MEHITNTNAVNELSFCRVIQNPPIPPLVKGGEGGFVQEFDIPQCQISNCVRINTIPVFSGRENLVTVDFNFRHFSSL